MRVLFRLAHLWLLHGCRHTQILVLHACRDELMLDGRAAAQLKLVPLPATYDPHQAQQVRSLRAHYRQAPHPCWIVAGFLAGRMYDSQRAHACMQDLDAASLATYQRDGEFGCFCSGILPACSQDKGTTGCLTTLAFSWFLHLVVGIQSLRQMQDTCFAVVQRALDVLGGLEDGAPNAKRPRGQDELQEALKRKTREMKTRRYHLTREKLAGVLSIDCDC
jgi:hypothetical protein